LFATVGRMEGQASGEVGWKANIMSKIRERLQLYQSPLTTPPPSPYAAE
jgi:hypothetical protein